MLKNKEISLNEDIINNELLKQKYLQKEILTMLSRDLRLNLSFIKDHLLRSWKFDDNVANFEDIEAFHDPQYKITIIFKINGNEEIKYEMNESIQDIFMDFMNSGKDERAVEIIKALIEFEYKKKLIRKGNHSLDRDTINELMSVINDLSLKYNLSKKQGRKMFTL